MKRILLTSTALVMAAGVTSAETSITWSGAATVGVARSGATQSTAATLQSVKGAAAVVDALADAGMFTSAAVSNKPANEAAYVTALNTQIEAQLVTLENVIDSITGAVTLNTSSTTAENRTDIAALSKAITTAQLTVLGGSEAIALKAQAKLLVKYTAILDAVNGKAAVADGKAGDFKSYSEVNATVTGSVATDNGITLSAAMSVDAGLGYDFADDDSFDTAAGGIGLDNITVGTPMGSFKFDAGAVAHLVDGDDDEAADLLYTNTFGSISVSAAVDLNKDTDATAAKASGLVVSYADSTTGIAGVTSATAAVAAVGADVQWSAKVSMPVAGGSAYVAMDEEGGNVFGASTTLGGVGISFSSKLEALEEELSADRENNIGLTYAMGATSLGATWNSKEDGDQWGISAAYAADGMTISASTDEGSDWKVSGSVALGTGASVVGGVNYTEDAYLGLSFAF